MPAPQPATTGDDKRLAAEVAEIALDLAEQNGADPAKVARLRALLRKTT